MLAAMKCNRNSIGIEVDRDYCRIAAQRLQKELGDFFNRTELKLQKQINTQEYGPVVREERAKYSSQLKAHKGKLWRQGD